MFSNESNITDGDTMNSNYKIHCASTRGSLTLNKTKKQNERPQLV